ncbi:hypothetical protein QQP08_002744 [Theobroma cacao]|nr:hypothetical protein QQP08_002744 [Theobroma cacao]
MSMNMEVFDAKEQAEASGHKPAKKGGRKPMLSEHQKRENKIQSCKNYRIRRMSTKRSEAENKSLKEKIETKARANKLETDLSDQSKIMNVVKMANEALKPGMRQLQQDFLDQDVQACKRRIGVLINYGILVLMPTKAFYFINLASRGEHIPYNDYHS